MIYVLMMKMVFRLPTYVVLLCLFRYLKVGWSLKDEQSSKVFLLLKRLKVSMMKKMLVLLLPTKVC